ncbi:protein transport protein Sec31A-like [Schistocerca cancellata]|uniref:protein transport protein Sec31A-like n=1 Tax=Schistocerca cancellata TaxID=274614 RepID=UPI0021183E55|nr:protein transport protein Sec31A-like [Schistocerca cancellata]
MLKLKESHSREDALLLFLSAYRSQPHDGRSPAELLHGRPHRTLMSLLHPPHQVPVQRQTPAFAPGDVVFYRNYRGSRRWLAGRILRCLGRAMYLVLGASGEVRRHLNQLRLCRRLGSAAPRLLSATEPSGQRPGDPSTGSPHPQVLPTMPSILPHGVAQPPSPPQPPPAQPAEDASLQPPTASLGHALPIASRDQLSSAMELLPAPDHMASSRVGYPDAMEVDPSAPPVSLRAHTPHVDVHPGVGFQAFPSSPRTEWPGAGGTASPVVRLPTSSHTSTWGPPHGGRKPYNTTVRRFAGEECGVTARHHTC